MTEIINPSLDLFAEIERLKREQNAVILAHYYQEPDIQDIADVLGDSLALARKAQDTDADVIVLCGVHFMAETAKILNPTKKVVVPDMNAGCSLADSCKPEDLAKLKAENPKHVVVSYVNTTAAVKALSDYCCTSSNATAVVASIPKDKPIIFAPDVNLGRYVQEQTGRDMLLWQGTCVVHETFNEKYVLDLLAKNPRSELIAHPECEPPILRHAHFIGSTKKLLDYTKSSAATVFVVATESGILHAMRKGAPEKTFFEAAPSRDKDPTCGCSTCPYMKLNTLEKVYLCLRDLKPEVVLDEQLRLAALRPIERMVAIG
ncbi:MAG: quinolinate synthase [Deltaproteobacteria bacterium RIFOXYB12_FULL_58_9]|nr:MAG: quinolinate synthase [Deltaproteobacteria bacterium RIFOXYB12_FULL_58_9]